MLKWEYTVGVKKKRHPLKMGGVLFSLGLNHSAYVKNEQNPPYNDLQSWELALVSYMVSLLGS